MSETEGVEDTEFQDRPELVRKQARFIFIQQAVIYVAAISATIALVIVTVNAFYSFQTRTDIADCITPGGKCFKDVQKRQAEITKQLIDNSTVNETETRKYILAGFICNTRGDVDTFVEYEECVNLELEQAND